MHRLCSHPITAKAGALINTFNWLLLGHLVGDWLLQSDWMAQNKQRGLFTRAGVVHAAVYTAAITGALWLSGASVPHPLSCLAFGAAVFLTHWLIDATAVVRCWMRFFGQAERQLVRLMVDQTMHLLVLAGLTVCLLGG